MIITFIIVSLILNFDGSLRPPRDPIPGFTRYPVTSHDSDKIASCSAAILIEPDEYFERADRYSRCYHVYDARVLAVGGKLLQLTPGMTSADAEYDGLLLGLEELSSYLSKDENVNERILNDVDPVLVIRGDCKAIIDQFNERSTPRKLELKYNIAMDRIRSIQDLYFTRGNKTDSQQCTKLLSLRFEHIPRENNRLCDAICNLSINQKQRYSAESIYDFIRMGEAQASEESSNREIMRPKSKRKPTRNKHFQEAFDRICNTDSSLKLCHSSQLALACELAIAAIHQSDFTVLSRLADFFMVMSRRWSRIYYFKDKHTRDVEKALLGVSRSCRTLSRQCVKASTDSFTDRGDEVIVELRSLLAFFTNSNTHDGMDYRDRSQYPFVDLPRLYDEIDDEYCRGILQKWDLLASADVKRGALGLEFGLWLHLN
ncbi:hypothetical protein HJC23_003646 [Cyclotella cryptica]|uniref:RNase H type-1 domain-containing protein n=1 Tax=Cyclotella cryptica TaxID=29204 RepID=A0ABD3QJ02_9STRA